MLILLMLTYYCPGFLFLKLAYPVCNFTPKFLPDFFLCGSWMRVFHQLFRSLTVHTCQQLVSFIAYGWLLFLCGQNIQSTNWQTMRFKPPPPNSNIGWRVEFRPMEVWTGNYIFGWYYCCHYGYFIVMAIWFKLAF